LGSSPGGHDVDRVPPQAGALEHVAQADAAPAGDADGPQLPLRAGGGRPLLGREEAAAVAGTLDERGLALARELLELAVGERERPFDPVPGDPQPPRGRVDRRRARVVADEEARGVDQVALVARRIPAHLGVAAVVDEPFRWERLDDRGRASEGGARQRQRQRTGRAEL
jgi:hypothetical protein